MSSKNRNTFLVPGSILAAGFLIAFAFLARSPAGTGTADSSGDFGNSLSGAAAGIRPVEASEHIRGNTDAPVSVVEFSDFECPFCARLHPTLSRLVDEYPSDVRWVYRHFPLAQIHSRAVEAAVASECMARLGGNEAFWVFADAVFENQHRLGSELYDDIAQSQGVSLADLAACMEEEKVARDVAEDFREATNSGGRGTPYVVVVSGDNNTFPFSGALPYAQVKTIVEQAINDS